MKYSHLIREALLEDKLIPFFQGIRNNKTGKISKYEVLARIVDEETVYSPFFFLEPARLSGLLPEITKMMIDKSFEIMSKNEYTFSINITEDDLSKNYLLKYLQNASSKYAIDLSRVILEILESVSASGKESHIQQLHALKALGCKLAIDDFGAEYSNFERLLDLDIDILKIDAQYIKNINTSSKSYNIVSAMAFFAKKSNMLCIAEYVHSAEVQKVIEELEIDFSQGYYFSEPSRELL